MGVPGGIGANATCGGGAAPLLTGPQLQALWLGAGGPANVSQMAAAVALAESGGDQDSVNCYDSNWLAGDPSVGLWQLIQSHAPGTDLTDPANNAAAAVALYTSQGWGPWTTVSSGAYLAFMGQAGAPGSYTAAAPQPANASPQQTSGASPDQLRAQYMAIVAAEGPSAVGTADPTQAVSTDISIGGIFGYLISPILTFLGGGDLGKGAQTVTGGAQSIVGGAEAAAGLFAWLLGHPLNILEVLGGAAVIAIGLAAYISILLPGTGGIVGAVSSVVPGGGVLRAVSR